MKLRILFTLAILVGLATAPGAQTFRWQAGGNQNDDRIRVRVDERAADRVATQVARAIERATWSFEHQWDRLFSTWDRHVDRSSRAAELRADRIQARVRAQVDAAIHRDIRMSLGARASRDLSHQGSGGSDRCDDNRRRDRDDEYEQFCEERESAMPAGALSVDAAPNGGITVEAWDRNEIHVRAIVRANARTEARAKEIAAGVQISTGGGRVSATGPDTSSREWWSVSYRVNVPGRNDLELNTQNGGVAITGVSGRVEFNTNNGGVTLTDLGGDVRGRTRNGGLSVALSGRQWDGAGLDVETTNGGVTLSIPEGYNARLDTRTQNGGFRTDYPLTITGDLSTRHGVTTTLGTGGPPVRVRTTNGGLKIGRR